jgi:hypothetical protein
MADECSAFRMPALPSVPALMCSLCFCCSWTTSAGLDAVVDRARVRLFWTGVVLRFGEVVLVLVRVDMVVAVVSGDFCVFVGNLTILNLAED